MLIFLIIYIVGFIIAAAIFVGIMAHSYNKGNTDITLNDLTWVFFLSFLSWIGVIMALCIIWGEYKDKPIFHKKNKQS